MTQGWTKVNKMQEWKEVEVDNKVGQQPEPQTEGSVFCLLMFSLVSVFHLPEPLQISDYGPN